MSFIVQRTTDNGNGTSTIAYMKLRPDTSGDADWVTDVNQASKSATKVASANSAKLHEQKFSSPIMTFTVVESSDVYTVATLPTPTPALQGTRAFVSDQQSAGQVGAKLNGGGNLFSPVYCDGAQWFQG